MGILSEYKQSLKMVEVEEPLDLYFYRIISYTFVKLIYPLPITPNQLSFTALTMGILAGISFGFGTSQAFFIAGALYALYYLFDLSDGQVARLKKNGTRLGRIIDGIADYVTHFVIFIGLGFGLGNTPDIWLLLLITLISLMAHVILFDFYRNRYLEYALGEISLYGADLAEFREEAKKLKTEGGHYFERVIFFLYLKYLVIQNLFTAKSSEKQNTQKFEKADFLKKNKTVIRLWSYMGSSLHITLLMVCSFVNAIEVYIYGILIFINAYAMILFLIQFFVDKKTKLKVN